MKRGGMGIALLAILLIFGIVVSMEMRSVHQDISQLLDQAAQSAALEDWQQAEALALLARDQWVSHHNVTAAFADHTPMDELDGLFAELTVFLDNRESPHFEATCARLSLLAQAMADSHGVQWWNVL